MSEGSPAKCFSDFWIADFFLAIPPYPAISRKIPKRNFNLIFSAARDAMLPMVSVLAAELEAPALPRDVLESVAERAIAAAD